MTFRQEMDVGESSMRFLSCMKALHSNARQMCEH
jgi:hypothetical protein